MKPHIQTLQLGMNASAAFLGGLDRYFYNLLHHLPASDVAVKGIVVGGPDLPDGFSGTSCCPSNDAGMFARWKALRGAVPRAIEQTNVAVTHFAPYAFPVLNSLRRRPHVVHFHGSWSLESAAEGAQGLVAFAKRALERTVYQSAARIIVLSDAYASMLTQTYGIDPSVIRVIPGGVDIARFKATGSRAEARRLFGLSNDRPILIAARRLVRAKGLQNLIDALLLIRKRIPDVQLLIAGNGPFEDELKRQVAEKGLDDAVRFEGFVNDALPTLFRAADLAIVPTLTYEGFGLVVLEALAAGTPALVTPISGLPQTVKDLDANLVLQGADPQSLARGICDALDGSMKLPDEAACIAYAGRFDWSLIAARVATVYREVA